MTFKRLMQILAILVTSILVTLTVIATLSMGKLIGFQSQASQQAIFYTASLNETRQAQVDFQRQVQEWKNILIRGNDAEMFKKYLAGFTEKEAKVQTTLAKLDTSLKAGGIALPDVTNLIKEHKDLGEKYREALKTWNAEDPQTGQKVDLLLRGIDRPASKAMDETSTKIEKLSNDKLASLKAEAIDVSKTIQNMFLGAAFVLGAAAILLCWKIANLVLTKVGAEPAVLEGIFSRIATGDLSQEIELKENDETSIAANTKLMQARMRSMVRAVKNNSDEVLQSSDSVKMGSSPSEVQAALRTAKIAIMGLEKAVGRFQV